MGGKGQGFCVWLEERLQQRGKMKKGVTGGVLSLRRLSTVDSKALVQGLPELRRHPFFVQG